MGLFQKAKWVGKSNVLEGLLGITDKLFTGVSKANYKT